MRYLRQFWIFLQSTFLKIDRIPSAIGQDECVTHFIFYHGHIDENRGLVDHAAFKPHKTDRNFSVYRIKGCSEKRIWLIGYLFVELRRSDKRIILARGDVECKIVFDQGLRITPKPSPHPRHAEVIGWPDDKPTQKLKQIALAQAAKLRLRPRADQG